MGWFRRVMASVALALVVVAGTVVAVLGKLLAIPDPGISALVAGLAFLAGLAMDPVKKAVAGWFDQPRDRQAVLSANLRLRDHRGRLLPVRKCDDPVKLGVHPAERRPEAPQSAPPYVRRDRDDLEFTGAVRQGGLVIVQGPSTAGKTRMAYEVVRREMPNRLMVVPATPDALIALVADVPLRDAVVWLDDIERYLLAGTLTASVLDGLCPHGRTDVVVVGTLRADQRRQLDMAQASLNRSISEVIDRATVVRLDAALSDTERSRADDLTSDPRITAALAHSDTGFAEFLAAGPATLDRYLAGRDGAQVTGYAIVRAAIDARRAGLLTPISRTVLEMLHRHYVDPRLARQRDLPSFDEGLAWAVEIVHGASSCLIPRDGDLYDPFEYLVAHDEVAVPRSQIPMATWRTLIDRLGRGEEYAFGLNAFNAGRREIAELVWRRAATAGDTEAMIGFGFLHAEQGRHDEAERWWKVASNPGNTDAVYKLARTLDWRYAADDGVYGMALNLNRADHTDEAVKWYRHAAENGHPEAMNDLAGLIVDEQPDEAERWYRSAADLGHVGAMFNLGVCSETGRPEDAEHWYQRAAEGGHVRAALVLARYRSDAGRTDEAEKWYMRAAEQGDAEAMNRLGVLAWDAVRTKDAEKWFREAAAAGHTEAMNNLGVMLKRLGQVDKAEDLYRAAADRGMTMAMVNLGTLMQEQGLTGEADRWYRRAAHKGDVEAMNSLGLLLAEEGREAEAIRWYETAANDGHAESMNDLAVLLKRRTTDPSSTEWARAEEHYRRAINGGYVPAMSNLAVLLAESGRTADARYWYRQALDGGDLDAAAGLRTLDERMDDGVADDD